MSEIKNRIEYLITTYCDGNNSKFANIVGTSEANIRNYLKGTEPKFNVIQKIAENFEINFEWLLLGKGNPTDEPNVAEKKPITVIKEKQESYIKGKTKIAHQEAEPFTSDELISIPLIDIEAAAGNGVFNPDYIEVLGQVSVPANMLSRRNGKYYAIRTRGSSMSPTIFDRDLLIIRYLDRGEWQDLRDEYVYIVVSREGNSYVKRIKDRLRSKGFIVLMSDNLDKTTYPNFILQNDEISNLFFTEMKISPYLPNINATYYDRMKILEDDMHEVKKELRRLRLK